MDNLEKILDDIEKFETNSDNEDLPDSLNDFLKHVAKTGDPIFPWMKVKNVIRHKLSLVMSAFYQVYGGGDVEEPVEETENVQLPSYTNTTDKILEQFDTFIGAPFTIQRICEMLLDPRKHYQNPNKFIRGMEKNILVVSCVTPGCVRQPDTSHTSIINGMIEDVSLHLGVNMKENNCDSGIMTNEQPNEVTANGVGEDACSSSSSSGSSSASSSPSPEDEQEPTGPSAKRPKLSIEESPSDLVPNMFEIPSCSTQLQRESSPEKEPQVDTSEQSEIRVKSPEQTTESSLYSQNNSAGSPDSAQDSNKNMTEMEKDTDDNCEATASEITEESSQKVEDCDGFDSSEADSTSHPSTNEASSTEITAEVSTKSFESECVASKLNEAIEDTAETQVISTSDSDNCKTNLTETPVSESPCTSSLPSFIDEISNKIL